MALQWREDVDTISDHCGLHGWAKIRVIGLKRDSLKEQGLPCSAEAVANTVQAIRWGVGREVTPGSATKMLTIWGKLREVARA
eukprot:3839573-Lingulodinium_polyedra.AAC.1